MVVKNSRALALELGTRVRELFACIGATNKSRASPITVVIDSSFGLATALLVDLCKQSTNGRDSKDINPKAPSLTLVPPNNKSKFRILTKSRPALMLIREKLNDS